MIQVTDSSLAAVPQSKREVDALLASSKEFSRTKHAQHERNSKKKDSKEESRKKAVRVGKWLKGIEKKHKEKNEMLPHALEEAKSHPTFASIFEGFKTFADSKEFGASKSTDLMLSHLENLSILIYDLLRAQTVDNYIVALLSFSKSYLGHKSIIRICYDAVDSFFQVDGKTKLMEQTYTDLEERRKRSEEQIFREKKDDRFSSPVFRKLMKSPPPADDIDVYLNDAHAPTVGTETFKEMHSYSVKEIWESMKSNPIFPKLSYLITVAMTSSLCSFKEINFELGGVKVIQFQALQEQLKTFDLIDALVSTFTWLTDVGSACLAEMSLAPILFDDVRTRDYNNKLNDIKSKANEVIAGNIVDLQLYERDLDDIIKETIRRMELTKSVGIKEIMNKNILMLQHIKTDIINKRRNTQYRFAPIGFCISGDSSIGKSDIAEITMKTSLETMGESSDRRGIVTLNEAEKFHSTYTSDIKGIFIDDANNAAPQFVETSPTRTYIQFFNNVAAQALKADVGSKGNVFIEFKVGVLTTNTKDLGVHIYSCYPCAVLRRFIHVSASVKPQYRVVGGTSLDVEHPDLVNAPDDVIVDVWQFNIEEVISDGSLNGHWQFKKYVDSQGKKRRCVGLNLQQYLEAIVYFTRVHKSGQDKQVSRNRKLSQMRCCETCKLLPQFCMCTNNPNNMFSPPPSGPNGPGGSGGGNNDNRPPTDSGPDTDDDDLPPPPYQNIAEFHVVREPPDQKMETQSLSGIMNLTFSTIIPLLRLWFTNAMRNVLGFYFHDIPSMLQNTSSGRELYNREFERMKYMRGLSYLPWWLSENRFLKKMVFCYNTARRCPNALAIQYICVRILLAVGIMLFLSARLCTMYTTCLLLFVFLHLLGIVIVCELNVQYEYDFMNSVFEQHAERTLEIYTESSQRKWAKYGVTAVAGLSTFVLLLKTWNFCRMNPQALTNPMSFDLKPEWFGWTFEQKKAVVKSDVKCTIPEHLIKTLDMNLCWARYCLPNGMVSKCCIFFPRKSVALFPEHVFYEDQDMNSKCHPCITIEVFRHNSTGGRFQFKVYKDLCYHFDGDMVAAFCPNCPDMGDKTKWMINDHPTGHAMVHILSINEECERTTEATTVLFGKVKHSYRSMQGGSYDARMAQKGSCMSVLVSETTQPAICGFHVAGNSISMRGMCMTITRSDFDKALTFLNEKAGFISSHGTPLPKTQYNRPVLVSDTHHEKAKVYESLTPDDVIDVMGSTKVRAQQTSQVEKSCISDAVAEVCGVPNQWGPPKLTPNYVCFNKNLEEIVKPSKQFDPSLLKAAEEDYLNPLKEKIEVQAKNDIFRPLTLHESINGCEGRRFIDPMPMKTGMGFPLFGKKNKKDEDGLGMYFEEVLNETGQVICRLPKQPVLDELERILNCYRRGERAYPVFTGSLKDESTKLTKEKVRVFQAGAVALGILIRKYFLCVARFFCTHPLVCELAVGINAFSPDWQEMVDYVKELAGDDQLMAWDYSKYDVRMNSQITRCVWGIFIKIARMSGNYNEDDLYIMEMMIVDITHPLTDFNGTMIMATSMNASGNNMTVFVNSVANSLYLRMAFFSVMENRRLNFREHNHLLTYGDDGMNGVHPDSRKFNFETFKEFMAEHDMKVTLPDKSSDEVPFLPAGEVDFLKRKSNFIPKIGYSIGMLDLESIFKSLHSNVKSKHVTRRETAISCIEGALHEMFAHGEEEYEKFREQMKQVCAKTGIAVPALSLDFDYRVRVWKEKYLPNEGEAMDTQAISDENLPPLEDIPSRNRFTEEDSSSECSESECTYLSARSDELASQSNNPDITETHLIGRSMPPAQEGALGLDESNQVVGGNTLVSGQFDDADEPEDEVWQQVFAERDRLLENMMGLSIEESLDYLRRQITFEELQYEEDYDAVTASAANRAQLYMRWDAEDISDEGFEPQSASDHPISSGTDAEANLEMANVKFEDAHPGFLDERGTRTDVLRESMEDSSVTLDQFFKRPIKIAQYDWNVGSPLFVSLSPWTLFFENPRVINRVTTYKNMKAVLHIKVTINGTSMHYGRLLASYQPLPLLDGSTQFRSGVLGDLVLASQRPCIYLNPAISQGGTLKLPFFTPFNMLDIPTAQWRTMGDLYLTSLTNLKHANAATGPVTISVFAWAEDVVLSGLTGVDSTALVPQALSEYTGILSKPMSTVAKVAASISEIPSLAGFAKATQIGASSIGYMANLFGYSKPRETNLQYHQIAAMDSIAVCDGRDNVHVLSIDSKQELTIDPVVAGLDSHDELTINSIASRETYVFPTTWATSFIPEDKIMDIVVDPGLVLSNNYGALQNAELYFPACAVAALPFSYWRGSMRYRFQFVCSSFHKGRVKLVWDPYASQTSSEYNVKYTQIVDLSEQNDFSVEIGWGQNTSWRSRLQPRVAADSTFTTSDGSVPADDVAYTANNPGSFGNGVLSMYVVSQLVSPNSAVNNNIQVLVSVAGGSDLEFCVPNEDALKQLSFGVWPNSNFAGNLPIQPLTAPGPSLARVSASFEEKQTNFDLVVDTGVQNRFEEVLEEEFVPQAATESTLNLDDPVESRTIHYMGPRPNMDSLVNDIYVGETVLSFRTLLKRYWFFETVNIFTSAVVGYVNFFRLQFPYYPQAGAYSNLGIAVPGGTMVVCRMTLLHFLTRCFGGHRGAIRYMTEIHNNSTTPLYMHHYRYEPKYSMPPNVNNPFNALGTGSILITAVDRAHGSMGVGGHVHTTSVTPYTKVEIPFQQIYRFSPAKYGNEISGADNPFLNGFDIDIYGAATAGAHMNRYVAAGEDFNLLMYLGPPVLFHRPQTLVL